MRPIRLLALSATLSALAACDGAESPQSQFSLGGAITGLDGHVMLADGTGFSKRFSQGGSFTFEPITYDSGTPYEITVIDQPAKQICDVKNGVGTIEQNNITDIEITCREGSHDLSLIGSVTGLTAPIRLSDGLGHELAIERNGAFSFAPVEYQTDDNYQIAVTEHGYHQQCSVTHAEGTFSHTDITSLIIECKEHIPFFDIYADVTGLSGQLALTETFSQEVYSLDSGMQDFLEPVMLASLQDGSEFNFVIRTHPSQQSCELMNASGTVTSETPDLMISCEDTPVYYPLTVNLSGSLAPITVQQGDEKIVIEPESSVNLPPLLAGTDYTIAIVDSPADHTCEISNETGTAIENAPEVMITCQLTGLTLSGTATGINGEVTLEDNLGNSLLINSDGRFNFYPKLYSPEEAYHISVTDMPDGQQCKVFYGQGVFGEHSIHDVQLVCHAEGTLINACSPPQQIKDGEFTLDQPVFKFGEGLGEGGFSHFDANLNGYPEILFGHGQGFGDPVKFTVIEYSPTIGSYIPLCESTSFPISSPASDGLFPSTAASIGNFSNRYFKAASFIAYSNGLIDIFNHTAGTIASTIDSELDIKDVLTADIDNDGTNELIVTSEQLTHIYSADTYQLEFAMPIGGLELTTGYFTQKEKLQLAINSGYVLEFSEGEYNIIWDSSALEFGDRYITSGDLDGDGLDEIIGGDQWYAIRAYNPVTKGILWDINPGLDIDALASYDVEGDGTFEIIYADRQHGSTYILDGATGAVREPTFNNPSSGVTEILVADFDNDGANEMIRGTGSNTTGPDYLFIIDLASNEIDWQTLDEARGSKKFAIGDLNGDQSDDYLFYTGSSNSISSWKLSAKDGITGDLLWEASSGNFNIHLRSEIHTLAIGDINGDGTNEIIAGGEYLSDGVIYILDALTGFAWETFLELEFGSPIHSIAIDDIDYDGDMEIIAGGGVAHTGSAGAAVHIFDGTTLELEKTLPRLSSGFATTRKVISVNFDQDDSSEIVAHTGHLFVLDSEVNSITKSAISFNAMTSIDNLVFAADNNGFLYSIDRQARHTELATLCNDTVTSLTPISDVDIAFTCEARLGIYSIDQNSITWRSKPIADNLGAGDNGQSSVINNEQILMLDGNRIYRFRRPAPL